MSKCDRGIAYQVVADGSTLPALEIPKPQDQQAPTDTAPPPTTVIHPNELAVDQPKPTPTSESDALTTGSSIPCAGGMLPLALFPLFGLLCIRNFKKDTTA